MLRKHKKKRLMITVELNAMRRLLELWMVQLKSRVFALKDSTSTQSVEFFYRADKGKQKLIIAWENLISCYNSARQLSIASIHFNPARSFSSSFAIFLISLLLEQINFGSTNRRRKCFFGSASKHPKQNLSEEKFQLPQKEARMRKHEVKRRKSTRERASLMKGSRKCRKVQRAN